MSEPVIHSSQEPYTGVDRGSLRLVQRVVSSAVVRSSFKATSASIIGQAPQCLVPLTIAITWGADTNTDAFFLAFALASFAVNALLPAAQQVAVPFFVSHREQGRNSDQFLGNISGAMLLLAAGFIVLVLPTAHFLLGQATSFAAAPRLLAERLLWGSVPFIFLSIIAGVWTGALNAERVYVTPALSPAVRSFVVIGAILSIGSNFGVYALVVAYTVGEISRLCFLSYSLRRYYSICFSGDFLRPRGELREFFKTGLAQIAGSSILGIAPLVDRFMASRLGPGNVSILDYAERLWQIPVGLFVSGFLVVSLSQWSHELSEHQSIAYLSSRTRRSATMLFWVCLPACAFIVIFRESLATMFFAYGRFPQDEVTRLANTLAALVVGLPFYVAGLVYTRWFLVLRRSDWLLRICVVLLVTKIVFNLIFTRWWGLTGIALSTTAVYALSLFLLMLIDHRWLRTSLVRT